MNKYIFPVYRILVPKPLRTVILKKTLRKKILDHYSAFTGAEITAEHEEVISFLRSSGLSIFPYDFSRNYSAAKVEVFKDQATGFRYVIHEGKKLFFKKRWGSDRIKLAWSELLKEQDPKSPHRYLSDDFGLTENDVIADIGAAEGNFSLSAVEKVKKIYLFERDREWIEALKITFAPWKDKVEIIGKYAGDKDDDLHIRIDTFWTLHPEITFLKIDVDGAEDKVMEGCRDLLNAGNPLKIALCTYHKAEDEQKFSRKLGEKGFAITPSAGFMINYYDKKLTTPWLRRGLLRAIR